MGELICEHCGAHLDVRGMPMDSFDSDWKCPKCEGLLTEKSYHPNK